MKGCKYDGVTAAARSMCSKGQRSYAVRMVTHGTVVKDKSWRVPGTSARNLPLEIPKLGANHALMARLGGLLP